MATDIDKITYISFNSCYISVNRFSVIIYYEYGRLTLYDDTPRII